MKIVSLKASNFKRLEAIEITPEANGITLISGNNDQGKSSAIESIIAALKLTELNLKKPIKDGADRAEVTVELDDLIIERTWTANDKSYLKVKTLDGASYPSPQTILDKFITKHTLDPLEFQMMSPKEQVDTLLKLVEFEVSPMQIDSEISKIYEERKLVNREYEKYRRILEELPEPEYNLPNEEIDVSAIANEVKELYAYINERKELARKLENKRKNLDLKMEVIHQKEVKIKKLMLELEELKTEKETLVKETMAEETAIYQEAELLNGMTQIEEYEKEIEDMQIKMAEATALNKKIQTVRKRQEIENMRDDSYAISQDLTHGIESLQARKKEILAQAKFPVEGLGFDDTGVTYQGLPLAQASGSDQLKVSLAVAMALNPELKVIFSKHGDVFDDNKLKVINEIVKEKDYQLWLERIHPGDLPYVLIEDGKIG